MENLSSVVEIAKSAEDATKKRGHCIYPNNRIIEIRL
jgi:hypothetical protein